MAQMYPYQLSPETKSSAEKKLYEAFRDQLDTSYVVFHGVPWQSIDSQGRPRDGEADFVLAHPDYGVLVLEVKGGGIRRDPHTNTWTSFDRDGEEHHIKNPVEQSRKSKYALIDALKMSLKRYLPVGHAVAFPDVIVEQKFLGMDLPRQIVLDATDLPQVSAWIRRVFEYWQDHQPSHTPFGRDGLRALVSLLGKQWELRPALWGQFQWEHTQLVQLTVEQYTILDSLNRERRMVINGFAGSGKTMLAVEKATRLARAGFRVLLLCYNKPLSAELRQSQQGNPFLWTQLEIYHFHELCVRLGKEYGITPPDSTKETYFDRDLPDVLLKVSQYPPARYDTIIVDEAQDFQSYWWKPLQSLLRDSDHGIFYLFFDENQRIYQQQPALPFTSPSFALTVNCRTTKSIHQQVLRFYHGEVIPTAKGPDGKPVQLSTYTSPQTIQQALKEVLLHLINEEGIPASEIVVLTPYSRNKSQITPQSITDQIWLRWYAEDKHIQIETIYSFKGLEKSVVVLLEIERWLTQSAKFADLEKLLYVGCSRARHYLIVLLSDRMPKILRTHFGEDVSV